ncbi:multiple monosaccharide ABC transporter permease [Dactylosporangium sp. McL0621]|uniref:multiple monosaccharide ABC transporter permease n=1 Tax=Dactylosporangium sp. McL0621 TaxID=3415678 RepID=UPI003CF4FAAA
MSTTETLQPETKPTEVSSLRGYLGQNLWQYGMLTILIAIVITFQILTDGRLLYPDNVAALVQQNAYVLILAIGMVMVIVAQHIDLSVGSIVAFIGGYCALMITEWHWPWPVAVAASVAVGIAVGCWQGFWIAYVGIPAFIVTLGGMLLFRGLAVLAVSQTVPVQDRGFGAIAAKSLPNSLGFLGNLDGMTLLVGIVAIGGLAFSQLRTRRELIRYDLRLEPRAAFIGKLVVFAGLIAYITYLLAESTDGTPNVLIIVGALVILYTYIMGNTVFGRHIYAMGGNLAAAKLSGVKTKRVTFLIFVNMGILASVAAVVTTSRAGAGVAGAGTNYELDAIAAAFIGGTAVTGGIGKVTGAVIGALIMGVLNMGLSILGVDAAWQQAIKGLVLIAAVAFDIVSKRVANSSQ